MESEPDDSSSEDSCYPVEPISGAVLLDQELIHQEVAKARGNIFTGCDEVDSHVLLGGVERGWVVGLSAEDEAFGLLLGLQTIARLLTRRVDSGSDSHPPTAMIITTLSNAELLPTLKRVVQGQVSAIPGVSDVNHSIRDALERISISRVFDFDGLREALDELDKPAESSQFQGQATAPVRKSVDDFDQQDPPTQTEPELQDSEDEGEPSSPGSPAEPTEATSHSQGPQPQQKPHPESPYTTTTDSPRYPTPDIVLVTNMPALITSLYATRDRKHAHRTLRHLSSRLRYLTRTPDHGGPLILLLNSTTSKQSSSPKPAAPPPMTGEEENLRRPVTPQSSPTPSTPHPSSSPILSSPPHSPSNQLLPPQQTQPLVPQPPRRDKDEEYALLSSLFNPPCPDPSEEIGTRDAYGYARHPNAQYGRLVRLSRRNRPFFGLRFAGMVDLHLLASRVPKREGDGEVFFSGIGADGAGDVVSEGVEFVWVVEVLGDEVGVRVWDDVGSDGDGEGEGRRFYREQRWAGVEIREEGGGVRVVDAGFERVEVGWGAVGGREEEEEAEEPAW